MSDSTREGLASSPEAIGASSFDGQFGFFRGAAAGVLGQVVLLLSALLSATLIARSADVSEVGTYAVAAAIAVFISVVSGLQLTQQISRSESLEEAAGYLPWSLVAAALGVLVSLLVIAAASSFGSLPVGPLAWLLPAVAVQPIIDALMGLLVREGRAGPLVAQNFLRAATRPLTIVVFVSVVGSMDSRSIALVDSSVAILTLVSVALIHRLPRLRDRIANRQRLRLWSLLPGIGACLVVAAGWQVIQRTDLLALEYFWGPSEAGLYSMALRLLETLFALYGALMAFSLPLLTSARRAGASPDAYIGATVLGAQFLLPCLVLFGIWGDVLAAQFFGQGYDAGVRVYAVLALGLVAQVATGPNGFLLMAGRRHAAIARVAGVVAVLNVLLNMLLVPTLGLIGGALASTCSLVLLNGFYLIAVRRDLGGLRSMIPVGVWQLAYLLSLAAALVPIRVLMGGSGESLVFGLAVSAVVFLWFARSTVARPVMRSLLASFQPARN